MFKKRGFRRRPMSRFTSRFRTRSPRGRSRYRSSTRRRTTMARPKYLGYRY